MSRATLFACAAGCALLTPAIHAAENDYSMHRHGAHDSAQHASHEPQSHGDAHAEPRDSEHAGHHASSSEPTESERRHVPPPAPQLVMHDMSNEEMIELMAMDDAAPFGMVRFDELEWRDIDGHDALVWNAQAWYGTDRDKLWLELEGERLEGETEGEAALYWDRPIARWWNVQAGVRHDYGEGPSRSWAGFGVQGLAPYWFEVEARLFVGEEGRTAATFSAEYEILLTQRLVLQPELELNLYGKSDREAGVGSGLADSELGLRLRYEIRRELAPYIGVVWEKLHGRTADLARAEGHSTDDVQLVAGLRVWF